jgi:sugar phosphate isomerase/epimerase
LRIVIDHNDFKPPLSEIHKIIQAIIPELEKQNVQLAIENHDRLKAAEFHEIVMKANSRFVGICLDSVNSIGADEGFETVFQLLAPHTISLHLKDYTIKRKSHMMGFDITGTPAGKGRLPVLQIINVLESHGKCRSVILELWPAPEQSIAETIIKEKQWVEESAQFLIDTIN